MNAAEVYPSAVEGDRSMRVLHLTAGNLYGGIETYLVTLARCRELVPEMEPHFGVCFPGRFRDELAAAGVPVYDLGAVRLSRPWTVLRARWRLRRHLRRDRFDAVVTHGCWPHVVFAPTVRRAGPRLAYAVHGVVGRDSWLSRWAARTSPDVVIANGRFTAATATKLFPQSPVEVVYLPVAAPRIVDQADARREVRAELGTSAETVVILQASRLEPWKGQAAHLDALARLGDLPGWEAWFAGGPQQPVECSFFDELKARAERAGIAGRVRFLGQRTDVPRLMAAADIYCQPNSGPEPFGIAFVEALLAGLPVVTSALGGALEIIDKTCGLLSRPSDATALADALGELIRSPERRYQLGTAGPARARELCNPRQQVAALHKTLARVVAPVRLAKERETVA